MPASVRHGKLRGVRPPSTGAETTLRPEINLNPVSRITAGAVGEPGHRTFYIQARQEDVVVSLLVEKGQVEALSRHIDALLARLQAKGPTRGSAGGGVADLDLEEPIVPEFRVGSMALGYDADRDLVLLQCEEVTVEEEAEEEAGDEPGEEPGEDPLAEELHELAREQEERSVARFWATRDQMRALARHASAVAAAGRPRCRLCGGPIDPEGHFCPARNGHRELGGLT